MNKPNIPPCLQITAVGSRITCLPAPTGTDQDWLVLVDLTDYVDFSDRLLTDGWVVGGSLIPNDANWLPASSRFNSFTKGEDNLIVTASGDFHKRFLAASSVAKRLNLLSKDDRIALFQAVLYAEPAADTASPTFEDNPFAEHA